MFLIGFALVFGQLTFTHFKRASETVMGGGEVIVVIRHAKRQRVIQVERPTGRQTERLTDRKTDRPTERQTDKQIDRQTDRHA